MTAGSVVTGHAHGEVVLWHDVSGIAAEASSTSPADSGKSKFSRLPGVKVVCTKLHWHAHPGILAISTTTTTATIYY